MTTNHVMLDPQVMALVSAGHPLANLFLALWTQVQEIEGASFTMETLAAKIMKVCKKGGSIYLNYEQGWGIDANMTITVPEFDASQGKFTATADISWSSCRFNSKDAIKGAELHLAVAKLAALVDRLGGSQTS